MGKWNHVAPSAVALSCRLEDLVQASQAARRAFVGVMRWRTRIAVLHLVGILALVGCALVYQFLLSLRMLPSPMAHTGISLLVGPVLLAIGSVCALVQLTRVVRWRFDGRLARAERVELNGSIPMLVVYTFPGVMVAYVLLCIFL